CNPTSSKFIHTWLRFGEIMRGSLSAPQAKVLAASFKTPRQALDCLLAGCESITLPLDVAQQMISYPAVEAAVAKFEQDWLGAFGRTSI
ncbi:hypothetical protein OEK97_27230, partial [Escherichia coli]|uniref:transaldolase family protein n=1 Tax=Escherichia coli TaxID=562 RepID=UPI0039876208|nr:hypothetical protein [Escherichia coli]